MLTSGVSVRTLIVLFDTALYFSDEPMIPEDHDEVDLNDFDPKVIINILKQSLE